MYYDGSIAGIKAYRIGTGQTINLYSASQSTTFSDMSFKGTLDIDETYCKANPTHLKAYYASNFPGTSFNGHSPNYITIYSVDDVNKTVLEIQLLFIESKHLDLHIKFHVMMLTMSISSLVVIR